MTKPKLDPESLRAIAEKMDVDAYCDKLAKSGSEHAHQTAFFGWLQWALNMGLHPLAWMAFAIPNGGERNPIVAARLKAEGVKSGVPDVCWPVPIGHYAGLYIELKVPKGSVSESQEGWHQALRQVGYAVAVCWSWRDARACFLHYANKVPVQHEYRADTRGDTGRPAG